MGSDDYLSLRQKRKQYYDYFKARLQEWALANGERLLETKRNPISFGIFHLIN